MKSINQSGYMKAERSISTNLSHSYGNGHSTSSYRDLSPQYKDTTFGTARRMYIPPAHKLDFIMPDSTLSRRYIAQPRSPRRGLQEVGLDAPAPTKYDAV